MTLGEGDLDDLVGRDEAVARVRAVASNRGPLDRTLLVTGPRGVGRTSVVKHALVGFDGDIMWFAGRAASGASPWAAMLNAAAALRSVPGFDHLDPAETIAQATKGELGVAELGRMAAETFRAMPRRDRPLVVVADDVHRCDPQSLALVVFLSHLNHSFDVSYILTCPDTEVPVDAGDLDRVELSGLDVASTHEALQRWSGQPVDRDLSVVLHAATEGNPRLLRHVAGQLASDQLAGRRALPVVPTVTHESLVAVEPLLSDLDTAELRILACFALGPRIPSDVLHEVGTSAVDGLVDRGLLAEDLGGIRIARAALGWLADAALPRVEHQELCAALSRAWAQVDPVQAALHGCRSTPTNPVAVDQARRVLAASPVLSDRHVSEALAHAVVDGARPPTARDWLVLATEAERAGHLLDAKDAFERATLAPDLNPSTDYATLARWRRLLSQTLDDPALAVPSSRLIAALDILKPAALFEVATRTAWNALLVGDQVQARTYLDQARQISRSSRAADRALWRLVDVSWHRTMGAERPEVLREAVLRWRHASEERDWYDDVLVVHNLLEAGAVDEARQELAIATTAHRLAGRHWNYFLPALRVRTELAAWNIAGALDAAVELQRSSLPGPVHVHGLGPALVRLEAVAGLAPGSLDPRGQDQSATEAAPLAAARAERDFIEGRYHRASVALRALLRRRPPLPPERRSVVVADLVECLVALGELEAADRVLHAEMPTAPAGPAAVTSRAAALVAPAFNTRATFARALAVAEEEGALVELARTQLAFARRLSLSGSGDEAEKLRAEAALLFEHHGMRGWQQHAQAMVVAVESAMDSQPSLTQALDEQELAIVQLLVQGLRNQQIANQLFISLRTLEKALTSIYAKLGVSSKAKMIALLRDTPPQSEHAPPAPSAPAREEEGTA